MKYIIIALLLSMISLTSEARPKGYLPPSPLWKKLNSIIIDKIEFEDEKPLAIFKYIRIRSKACDPAGKGVNFVFKGLTKNQVLITLKLKELPLAEVIKYVCLTGDLLYKVDRYAVVIMPKPVKAVKK